MCDSSTSYHSASNRPASQRPANNLVTVSSRSIENCLMTALALLTREKTRKHMQQPDLTQMIPSRPLKLVDDGIMRLKKLRLIKKKVAEHRSTAKKMPSAPIGALKPSPLPTTAKPLKTLRPRPPQISSASQPPAIDLTQESNTLATAPFGTSTRSVRCPARMGDYWAAPPLQPSLNSVSCPPRSSLWFQCHPNFWCVLLQGCLI